MENPPYLITSEPIGSGIAYNQQYYLSYLQNTKCSSYIEDSLWIKTVWKVPLT